MKNYKQPGNTLSKQLNEIVSSGGVYDLGAIVGVAAEDGVTGDRIEFAIDGVYDLDVATGPFSQGQRVFRNSAGLIVASDTLGLQFAGIAMDTGPTGPSDLGLTVPVKLNFGMNAITGPTGAGSV